MWLPPLLLLTVSPRKSLSLPCSFYRRCTSLLVFIRHTRLLATLYTRIKHSRYKNCKKWNSGESRVPQLLISSPFLASMTDFTPSLKDFRCLLPSILITLCKCHLDIIAFLKSVMAPKSSSVKSKAHNHGLPDPSANNSSIKHLLHT